jgi:tRNA A-37 threonylcarbamoyl transferase component Bud32/tetratricopeptide (TPR) repeat protein
VTDRATALSWDLIEPLLDRVLDLDPAGQARVLDETRAGDPALAREVARLAEADRRAGDFLESPALAYAAPLLEWVAEREPLEAGGPLGRYRIVRRIGRGATATVYLAQDPKHGREVAIKVLHPELAVSMGPERFLREIEIVATLHHPHILPLFDSGAVDGLLYYVMPHVEGESLRRRLAQQGRLSLDEALRIAREAAGALDYAHRHGLVHRDVKPENILIQDGQAIVADFGIARAIDAGSDGGGDAARGTGTPAYMSPEQAAGAPALDGRTDIYALGCVAYEMIQGAPPFRGDSVTEVLARHADAPVPPLAPAGLVVPAEVERAIARALAKRPEDRFATAEEFARALDYAGAGRPAGHRPRAALLLAGVSLAAVLVVWGARGRSPSVSRPPLDPRAVAVLPFELSAADSGLGSLGEAMTDLVRVRLTGEGGPRAVEPQALGEAGRMVRGAVTGDRGHLVVTASLPDAGSGRGDVRGSAEGPADSLGPIADRLVAQLLVGDAGEAAHLADLARAPLPALRAYLDGRRALRRGEWDSATAKFTQALDLDSTLVRAALGLTESASWGTVGDEGRGTRLAWAGRARLAPADRTMLAAMVGPRYPDQPTMAENIRAAERAVSALPDEPQAWFRLGDLYYHWGAGVGLAHPLALAGSAFRRAVALDSGIARATPNAEPLTHLFQIAAIVGDTATVLRLRGSADTTSDWRAAAFFGDSAALARLRGGFSSMETSGLLGIVTRSLEDGLPLADADRAVRALESRASTHQERASAAMMRYLLLMSRGRPDEAAASLEDVSEGTRFYHRISGAVYWDGDSASGAAEVRSRLPEVEAPLPRDEGERALRFWTMCMVGRWQAAHADWPAIRRTVARLRTGAAVDRGMHAPDGPPGIPALCADMLEAWLAADTRRPDAAALAHRLDGEVRQVPPPWTDGDNLTVARLLEEVGDVPGALAAVRRRRFDTVPVFLSTYLREEGRLAALSGDTASAISAYRRYLIMQDDPEPALRPRVEAARAELARLETR